MDMNQNVSQGLALLEKADKLHLVSTGIGDDIEPLFVSNDEQFANELRDQLVQASNLLKTCNLTQGLVGPVCIAEVPFFSKTTTISDEEANPSTVTHKKDVTAESAAGDELYPLRNGVGIALPGDWLKEKDVYIGQKLHVYRKEGESALRVSTANRKKPKKGVEKLGSYTVIIKSDGRRYLTMPASWVEENGLGAGGRVLIGRCSQNMLKVEPYRQGRGPHPASGRTEAEIKEELKKRTARCRELEAEKELLEGREKKAREAYERTKAKLGSAEAEWEKEAAEREKMEKEVYDLKNKVASLENAEKKGDGSSKAFSRVQSIMKTTWPGDLASQLKLADALWPGRLAITSKAVLGAKDWNGRPQDSWFVLQSIATVLWEAKFTNEGTRRIAETFQNLTGLECSLGESELTSGNKKMLKKRRVVVDGKAYACCAHVKKGNNTSSLRIHFDFDEENRRIVLGHCGKHLETMGTAKRGF